MAFKLNFKTVFFAGLLLGGCSSDMAPQGDDEQTSGASGSAKTDAGAKADAGKADAGKADAGKNGAGDSSEDDGDEATDDGADDTSADDTSADDSSADETDSADEPVDAGTKADAGGAKPDAGGTMADAGGACSELTYAAFGESFIETYCIACHGKMEPTFMTLDEVVTNKAMMKKEVTEKLMPPKGAKAPTDQERSKFAQFLDCGPK